MSLVCRHVSLLDQSPERSVVEVVDVAVHLSPRKIGFQVLFRRVEHYSGVKGWDSLRLHLKEVLEPVDKGRGEEGQGTRHNLVFPTVENLCLSPEDERVLV